MGTPFIGELKIISWNFPPQGWAFCNGQLLPINQNQALFSILGTTYGGNGQTNFGLPNLQGRIPIHTGNGFVLGEAAGQTAHTLNISEMPAHVHGLIGDSATAGSANSSTPTSNSALGQSAGALHNGTPISIQMYGTGISSTLSPLVMAATGGSQPHNNMSPYLVLNVIIALVGEFPSQN